jgi:multidrug efflux pump subunit AcrA (membrane-fusion protein)
MPGANLECGLPIVPAITSLAESPASGGVNEGLVNLLPGMAVTVEIKTGPRRFISYLLSPLVKCK